MEEPVEAEAGEGSHDSGRKRKREGRRRKLLEGEEVEVRLSDEGLKGSWHRAVVVKCERGARFVKYNEILAEDNSTNLVERIMVTCGADGLLHRPRKHYRGWIRPLLPARVGDELEPVYGMCVDCLIDGAWWEGVIFDKVEGSSQRMVFFPDQGDQHLIEVSQMRHTYDWNEISGDWQLRGTWTFLKLLCKLEEKGSFPISIREIFYDATCTDFYHERIGEWIFGTWPLWLHLVTVAIKEALAVSLGKSPNPMDIVLFTNYTDSPATMDDFGTNDLDAVCLDSIAPGIDDVRLAIENVNGDLAGKGQPKSSQSKLCSKSKKKHFRHCKKVEKGDCFEITLRGQDDCSDPSETTGTSEALSECVTKIALLKQEYLDLVSRSRLGPKYFKGSKIARCKARKYLLSVGWKINKLECGIEQFVSPIGGRYMTLKAAILACSKLEVPAESIAHDDRRSSSRCNCHSKSMSKRETHGDGLRVVPEEVGLWQPIAVEAEYCIESVLTFAQYLKNGKSELKQTGGNNIEAARLSLRKHLVALGWKILMREDPPISKKGSCQCSPSKKMRYQYVSPDGKKFAALQKVVPYLMKTRKYCSIVNTRARGGNHCSEPPHSLDAPEREAFDTEQLVPESCPEALPYYINFMENKNDKPVTVSREELKTNKVKALKHLLYLGWTFYYVKKRMTCERRYNSPDHKSFCTLLKACKASLEEPIASDSTEAGDIANEVTAVKKADNLPLEHTPRLRIKFRTSVKGNLIQECRQFPDAEAEMGSTCGESQRGVKKINCGKNDALLSSVSLDGLHDTFYKRSAKLSTGQKKTKKRKVSGTLDKDISETISDRSAPHLSKQARAVTPSPSQHTPRTVLSWLIDNGIISPRQKVKYMRKRDGQVLMEGLITHGGIKCKCCRKVLTLSNFELHAGSSNHRPCANIFLKDGRSLLDCQRQLLESEKPKDFPHKRIKHDYSVYPSDAICSICQDGGILVLCDHCPSSFHLKCVGLKDVPEGKWFCPSCECSICGLSEFNSDCEKFTPETKLFCDQCECEYHVGCLQEGGLASLTRCPEGYWFCSKTCSEIFWRLRKLVGKTNPTALGDYMWTILRAKNENDLEFGILDKVARTEEHSKLRIALDVLHECFMTIIEPRTKTDLVADLLDNKESELNRLNFWGFYTILLEKGDEVVSVATFRVYGNKVAEMPLVGTRVQYRRKGMCRLLINELEKLLNSMGVERFLLPAVPELLETWTKSFGFTVMTDSDKLMLSRYTFLSFQSTTMCQKFLMPTVKRSEQLLGNVEQVEVRHSMTNMETDCNGSATPEVLEMVPPTALPCSAADNSRVLPSDNGMVGSDVDSGGSFPNSGSSDDTGLLQEDDGHKELKDQTPMNIAPVEFDHNCNFAESDSTILAVKSVGVNCEIEGEVYKSHARNDINNFLMKSSDTFRVQRPARCKRTSLHYVPLIQ